MTTFPLQKSSSICFNSEPFHELDSLLEEVFVENRNLLDIRFSVPSFSIEKDYDFRGSSLVNNLPKVRKEFPETWIWETFSYDGFVLLKMLLVGLEKNQATGNFNAA